MADFSDLVDLAQLAQAMGKQHVFLAQERCLPVRHRKARCRSCVEVCPAGAIEVSPNHIAVDHAACVGCCACTTVCPTEALVPLEPPDVKLEADLETLLAEAKQKNLPEGTVCIGCARKAARHEVDDQAFLEVPCLCRMHESTFLSLMAKGATDIVLVDGNCRTCKLNACGEVTDRVVENVAALTASKGVHSAVRRSSQFPEGMPPYQAQALQASRRAFFTASADQGKNAAAKTARFFIRKEAKKDTTVAAVLDSFGLTQEEESKITEPQRMTTLVDALYEVGLEPSGMVDSRFFGSLDLRTVKCSLCGVCAVVCPTKALSRCSGEAASASGKKAFLSFWPSDCVQCHLCEDVCFRKCLTVNSEVPIDQVFSFEPQLIGK